MNKTKTTPWIQTTRSRRRDTSHEDPGRFFCVQESPPNDLDSSLLRSGVLVRLGMGWFGGLITRPSQERTRHQYDNRVHLEEDQSTRSIKLPLEKYSGDPEAVKGFWILLEEPIVTLVNQRG